MSVRTRLLEVLPEIGDIENRQWREACISIWVEAVESSCWDDVMEVPNNPDTPKDSLVRHTRGVLRGALALAQAVRELRGVEVDCDKLRVICLLHDVCKVVEQERDGDGYRKSKIGTDFPHGYFSSYYCVKYGLPLDMASAVASHSQFVKNVPSCLEGVLQFYADMADADVSRFLAEKPLLIGHCKI